MKKGIHPEYQTCVVSCTCGNTIETRSTKPEIRVEVCAKCHPFYAGTKQLFSEKGGRVERFKKKYGLE